MFKYNCGPTTTKEIHVEVYDPTRGTMEDDAWVEVTFEVPLSFEPDDPSVGYRGGWSIDGDITDDDGYKFSEYDINDMNHFCHGTDFDWDALFEEAAQEMQDRIDDAKIEAYEARMEVY